MTIGVKRIFGMMVKISLFMHFALVKSFLILKPPIFALFLGKNALEWPKFDLHGAMIKTRTPPRGLTKSSTCGLVWGALYCENAINQ